MWIVLGIAALLAYIFGIKRMAVGSFVIIGILLAMFIGMGLYAVSIDHQSDFNAQTSTAHAKIDAPILKN